MIEPLQPIEDMIDFYKLDADPQEAFTQAELEAWSHQEEDRFIEDIYSDV